MTNLYESLSGVLNIAPDKISGTYKIIVTENSELYLDDYNLRRVKIDTTQRFLPQVSNFLSTMSQLNDVNLLKYGGFNYGKTKAYHIPLYLGTDKKLPKYFVLNRVGNRFTQIQQPIDLYKTANILKVIDLDKIGILNIFNEIHELFDYPLNFNWEEKYVDVIGYGIKELTKVSKKFDLLNIMSNQPYIENLNNSLLNFYVNNEMFFPKFINIEFEFNDSSTNFDFYNYFGFYSNQNLIDTINPDNISIQLKNYTDKIEWKQIRNETPNVEFDNLLFTKQIKNINNQEAQIRLDVKTLSVGDKIQILHPDNSLAYQYIITSNDIKKTIQETLALLCIKLRKATNHHFHFNYKPTTKNHILTVVNMTSDDYNEDYILKVPSTFKFFENKSFYGITDNDFIYYGSINIDSVSINNKKYEIVNKFIFDGLPILRLNENPNINNSIFAEFYEKRISLNLELLPIPYLSFNDTLKTQFQYDKQFYISELKQKFTEDNLTTEQFEAFQKAIIKFENVNNFVDILPYVNDVINDTVTGSKITINVDELEQDLSYNNSNIKNMMFTSVGNNAYIKPNILNLDKHYWEINGNLNYPKVDSDPLCFHWFLIKGEAPTYTLGTDLQLRYFTEEPKIVSRLIKNGNICETIFLGVKYQLPIKYENYNFCVYLNSNDDKYPKTVYNIKIENNTVMIIINKYLDFIDLIRGGNVNNQPFIDLSFFYCVNDAHNSLSNYVSQFRSGGVEIADTTIPVMFEGEVITDWKKEFNGKQYICLKRSTSVITDKFTELFPEEEEFDFYLYSKVKIDETVYDYIAVKITVIGLRTLADNYLWCEDLKIKFFDTQRLFVNFEDEFHKIEASSIISIDPLNPTATQPYRNFESNIEIYFTDATNKVLKIINPVDEFSLKEYYFETSQKIEYINNKPIITKSAFTFNEYFDPTKITFEQLNEKYHITYDNQSYFDRFSLFERNQLWNLLKSIIKLDSRFKHNTPKQVRKTINELLVNNLAEFSDLNSLSIIENDNSFQNDDDKFIKIKVVTNDENLVIWKHYPDIGGIQPTNRVTKIYRYRGPQYPHLRKLNNELDFQADINTNKSDVLQTIFDKNYAGENINATGFWNQISGNVVSSLFAKTDDIILIKPLNSNLEYNINKLLIESIPIEDMIIVDNNEDYIQILDNNINNYIQNEYVINLLNKFYYLDSVYNNLGLKLNFDSIFENSVQKIKVLSLGQYELGPTPNLKFIFKRK